MSKLVEQKAMDDYGQQLQQLCNAARRISESPSQIEQNFKYYINYYIQHQRLSQQFFHCLCEHSVLQKLLNQQPKQLPSIRVLELFHLLVSNMSKPNDLVYVFSQPIVHEYLFERFNLYKESGEAIEYYVQLLKTIIMKSASEGNHFLLKLFCNKRFPTFPILTASTLLAVSQHCDELVRITAQQCVLMLVNLINQHKTGLVYLNELQMIVFFFELIRQMLDEENNTDREGSLRYFVDLVHTLKDNQTSIFLIFNLLANQLFFKFISAPHKSLRFIRELRDQLIECPQFQCDLAEEVIGVLYRIFYKYYFGKFINYTYYCAQQIVPGLNLKPQPKLLKFFSQRCKKIDEYLVNEEDYFKSEKGNECLIEEWVEFNRSIADSPLKSLKKSSLAEFFSAADSTVDRYIKDVMVMAGLEVEKLKIPIIKLTYSSNFKTSLFLTQAITYRADKKMQHEEYCREKEWGIEPSEQFFAEIYLLHLNSQKGSVISAVLVHDMEAEIEFMGKVKPQLVKMITFQLSKQSPNISKNYLLLLFKLLSKLRLNSMLQPTLIQKLLERLFQLQKIIGQQLYDQLRYPSYFKYVVKNQARSFTKQKIDKQSIISGKFQLGRPKQTKLQHYIFYYEVIKHFLDPSLKNLNEFVQEYWTMHFKEKDNYKPLLSYRDIKKNYISLYATDSFEFQVLLQTKEQQLRFSLSENDLTEKEKRTSSALHFQEYDGEVRFQNSEAALLFRRDVEGVRETRKDIFRRSLLQYMPFIYESIEVKYRNHRYQSCLKSN